MKVNLEGRTALVTVAAMGIGQAIVLALASNGATVAVDDIDPVGQSTVEEIRRCGGNSAFHQADVWNLQAVNAMVAEIEEELGPIDIVINNAGINLGKQRFAAHEFPDSD